MIPEAAIAAYTPARWELMASRPPEERVDVELELPALVRVVVVERLVLVSPLIREESRGVVVDGGGAVSEADGGAGEDDWLPAGIADAHSSLWCCAAPSWTLWHVSCKQRAYVASNCALLHKQDRLESVKSGHASLTDGEVT